jgi:hypothetical protein
VAAAAVLTCRQHLLRYLLLCSLLLLLHCP